VAVGFEKTVILLRFCFKIDDKLHIKLGFCDIAILVVHGELFIAMNYIL